MRARAIAVLLPMLFACSSARGPSERSPRPDASEPIDSKDLLAAGITPVAVFQPAPPYPASARNKNLMGTVVLEIVVDTEGVVTSTIIVESSPPFDEGALITVKKWRYQPIVIDGRAVSWKANVNLHFKLR